MSTREAPDPGTAWTGMAANHTIGSATTDLTSTCTTTREFAIAQPMANYESERTAELDDRRVDHGSLGKIKRIRN